LKFFTIIKDSSERLPGKNFLDLGGAPLFLHTVSRFAEYEVFINTDSDKLSGNQHQLPETVTVFPRAKAHIDWEAESETRGSPVNAMLEDFLDNYVEDDHEPIVLFHVTSPFIKLETVKSAAKFLGEYNSVQSVQSIYDFAWLRDENEYKPINFNEKIVSRTQDLPPVYLSRGAFFILTKSSFRKSKTRDARPRYFYELSPIESIEIDTPGDFELAQAVVGWQ
jgi:CMP-N-acetylneuraminic acid synthetase